MKGTISTISVAGMLRLICSYEKSGVFKIDGQSISGDVSLENGVITDVRIKGAQPDNPRAGLVRLLSEAGGGSFYFEEGSPVGKTPAGIDVEDVILESSRGFAEKNSDVLDDFLMPENEVLKITTLHENKKLKVLFTPDEWNVMISFNGDSNIKSAFENSGVEKKKARAALYGLVSAGLLRRARFKIPEIGKIALEHLGNIGLAIVDAEMARLKIDRTRMGMRDFLNLLNSLEKSFADITGKSRAQQVIEIIWNGTK